MRTFVVLTSICALASAAPVQKEIKQTPLDRLQGKWVIVSMDRGEGQKAPADDSTGYTMTFDGEKFSSSNGAMAIFQNVAVKFDFDAKPMRMTIGGLMYIFKFEDGQLWKCHGQGGVFLTEIKGGSGCYCTVMKRAEK
jgi:uncharacterized protein (TIGR03067 family)